MLRFIFLTYALALVSAGGNLHIVHQPSNLKLQDESGVSSANFDSMANELLGLDHDGDLVLSKNNRDILHRPEALAVVFTESPSPFTLENVLPKAPLVQTTAPHPNLMETLSSLEEIYSQGSTQLMLSQGTVTGNNFAVTGPEEPLKMGGKCTEIFAKEMAKAQGLVDWISSNPVSNGVPDLYVLDFEGVSLIADGCSENSQEYRSAMAEFGKLVGQLNKVLREKYGENYVLIHAEQAPYVHKRIPRAAAVDDAVKKQSEEKYFKNNLFWYNEDYPAAFNITLWLCIALGVGLLFITVGIWFMDPGKDSIIYRMTMSKKTN